MEFITFCKGHPYGALLTKTVRVVKITSFLLLACCLHMAAATLSQNISFSGKDVSLEKVFTAIKKQSDFLIVYNKDILKRSRPVSVDVKDIPLADFLQLTLADQGISFLIENKTIILKVKEPELGPSPQLTIDLPPIKITGIITGLNNQPLAGATIRVKGKNITTVSDEKGYFELNAEEGSVLSVSYVGFKERQIRTEGSEMLKIGLEQLDNNMDTAEVTINTGYERIRPERFVGSATVLDSAILQRFVSTDIISRLEGVTPGLLFVKSGGIQQLAVRGTSTLNANYDFEGNNLPANPLIILDEFPFYGNLNSINPNDIESISVLKDAAATSIWGARAGNGVIVITSKKGSNKSRFSISFNSNVQVKSKPDADYYQRMTSSDFIDVEKMLFDKGFFTSALSNPFRFANSPVVELLNKVKKEEISEDEANVQINSFRNIDVNDQYNRYILRNAINVQNYLNVSGGNNAMGYNISIGANNDETGIKGPGGANRYTINSGISFKPIRALEFNVNVNYANDLSRNDNVSSNIAPGGRRGRLYPYARFADENGNPLVIPFGYRLSWVDSVGQGNLLDWHYRPLDELYLADRTNRSNFLRLQAATKVKLTDWLNLGINYQYGNQIDKNRNYRSEQTFYTRDLINFYTDPATFVRNIPLGGILDQTFSELITHNFRTQLNFNKHWGVNSLTAIAATEISNAGFNTTSNRIYGYNDEIITSYPNIDFSNFFPVYTGGVRLIQNFSGVGRRSERFASFLANLNYNYDSRYSLFISARRDGSNLLGVNTNNKWKPLWSVGGRWNISNENFYKINWINNLSIRATYGYSGNVSNTVPPLSIIKYNSNPNQFNQIFATMQSPPNPDLRWEEVGAINLGVDFSLLANRISATIEWYQKKATDLITGMPFDPTAGLPSGQVTKNAANLSTRGVDISLNTVNIDRALKWTSVFNASLAKTIVARYFFPIVNMPTLGEIVEGRVLGALYAYRWAGLDPETGDPRGYLGTKISTSYADIFRDSAQYQQYIGSGIPLFFGNLMNNFSFKGFELSFNISFKANYYFRKPTISYFALYNSWNSHRDFEKRWQKPGDEQTTTVPSMPYPANIDRDNFYRLSEANVEKGDHIRLQDARIAYDFSKLVPGNTIKTLQLFVFAGNLNYLIWKQTKSGYDPDFPVSEPIASKTYSIGVRVGL